MRATIDGNEAAASVAYRLNEVCCIYPITPSSPMAELADEWSSRGRPNVWGTVPAVVEMQSEGGAAGALHGALQGGALGDDVHRVAGPAADDPEHVQDRRRADAGGHPRRGPLARRAGTVDLRRPPGRDGGPADGLRAARVGLGAGGARPRARRAGGDAATRVPFVHFFDGFRTSHELNTIELLSDDDLRALVPEELVRAHRDRALSPERPFIRGTAQNPDVYFQARETVNPFYARVAGRGRGRDGSRSPSAPAAATTSSTTPAIPRPSGSSCSWAPARRRRARRSPR